MKKNILVLLLFPFIVFSQQWTEDLQNPNKNFYEIQEEFESYWENKTYEKGKGCHQHMTLRLKT